MYGLETCQFIDIHYHASPDLYQRRLNAIEAGLCYQALGGAVFLKSHLGATSVQASLAQGQGLPVFPSLVLNQIAGGIDYRVVLRALAEYQSPYSTKMIVHFPTITGRKYQSKLARQLSNESLSDYTLVGETLFDEQQHLRSQVFEILRLSRDYPIVLSTGHASKAEIYALLEACIQHGVENLLLNQPANPLTGLKAAELRELTQETCVWIEQTALTYLLGHQSKEDFAEVLSSLPRVIYSSDLGQTSQMEIGAWLEFSQTIFKELQLPIQRQEALWRKNALNLLTGGTY